MTVFETDQGAVIVRLYYTPKGGEEVELDVPIEDFKYVYDEEGDDCCTLVIHGLAPDSPDLPQYQEEASLRVVYGYMNGVTKQRKVYVKDTKWEFTKEGRRLTLDATEKAVTLKQSKSRAVHNNTNLPGIVADVAEKHGLDAYLEWRSHNYKDAEKPPYPYPSEHIRELYEGPDPKYRLLPQRTPARKPPERGDIMIVPAFIPEERGTIPNTGIPEDVNKHFRVISNYNQGAKTDLMALQELGQKEGGGEYLVETRDDSIVLKRRNYNKKPLRAYRYDGGLGELLSFIPETKNKQKGGSNTNFQYSAWDNKKKEFTVGNANLEVNDPRYEQRKTYLAQILRESKYIPTEKTLRVDSEGNIDIYDRAANRILKGEVQRGSIEGWVEVETNDPRFGTNLRNKHQTRYLGRKGVLGEDLLKLRKAVNDYFEGATNNLHSPSGDLKEAFNSADNARDTAELKTNPAQLLVIGNVDIETGQILTIENVGNKYSGNYYVIKTTHVINKHTGYTTSVEAARSGHNGKASSNEKAAKDAEKLINQEMGVDKRSIRTREINATQNRR